MSPFSRTIRMFRESRKLRQSDAAELLGVENSYLCGLETGSKGTPNSEFVRLLVKRYALDEVEIEALMDSLKLSNRRITIPLKASCEEYKLVNNLNEQLGNLSVTQINLMQIALDMGANVNSYHR